MSVEIKLNGVNHILENGRFIISPEQEEKSQGILAKISEDKGIEILAKARAHMEKNWGSYSVHSKRACKAFLKDETNDLQLWRALQRLREAGAYGEKAGELHRLIPHYFAWSSLIPGKEAINRQIFSLQLLKILADLAVIPEVSHRVWVTRKGKRVVEYHQHLDLGGKRLKNQLAGIFTEEQYIAVPRWHNRGKLGGHKLNGPEKAILKGSSNTAFRLRRDVKKKDFFKWVETSKAKTFLEEKLEKAKGDKAKNRAETQLVKFGIRAEESWKAYEFLKEFDELFIGAKFDDRKRVYKTFNLLGLNMMGQEFESSMWEFATPILIEKDFIFELAWDLMILSGVKEKKVSSVQWWEDNRAHVLRSMRAKGRVSEPYANLLIDAIQDAEKGVPSHFIWKRDANNSGGQHMAALFKSQQMAETVEIVLTQGRKLASTHDVLNEQVKIDRADLKKAISGPVFHGGSISGSVKRLKEFEVETTTEALSQQISDAIGPVMFNSNKIAQWGSRLYNGENPMLRWTRRDGVRASSVAIFRGVDMRYVTFSERDTKDMTDVVWSDLPYMMKADNSGPIFMGHNPSVMGLYANIIHSFDGYVVAQFARAGVEFLPKHDDFGLRPTQESLNLLEAILGEHLQYLQENDEMGRVLAEIANGYQGNVPSFPALWYGDKPLKITTTYAYTA